MKNHATPQGFKAVWWTAEAGLMDSAGKYDPSKTVIQNIAKIAEHGGVAPITGQKISAGEPVFLDFEVDETESVSWYQQRIEWFHEAAPNVKVGIWGLPLGWSGLDEDMVASDTPQIVSQIDANLRAQAPLIDQMDMITLSAYLLGPASVNTTFKYISVMAGEYHKLFPGKQVVCWMWGAYHIAWNPANDVEPDSVTQQYIQTAMNNCNAMLVWGPDADNSKIEKMAYQMDVSASSGQTSSQSSSSSSLFSDSSIQSTDPSSVIQ